MVNLILMGCMLIIAVALFVSYQSAAGIRKNLRMSVKLPMQFLNHPEVLVIVNKYKKRNVVLLLLSIAAFIPVYFMRYTSLQLIYLVIWIGFLFVLSNRLYCNYNNKLILLKSKNLWFIQEYEHHTLVRERVQRKRNALLRRYFPTAVDRLLAKAMDPIHVDEDEHWINGYYYNQEDITSTALKRVGTGYTMNLATKSGRITAYATGIFITLVFGAILGLFVRMDFATFQMVIGEDTVTMKAPLYRYEFNLDEVEEISLAEKLPERASRTNGAATETYYLGNFHIEGYGSSKVYIYRNYPPYIIIKLKDKTIFFNTRSRNETIKYYEQLQKAAQRSE